MTENGDGQGNNTEYEVGYGKPPKATRWQKGQSGNPQGRPPKIKYLSELVGAMLDQKADYIAPGALPTDQTWRELIARAMLIKASQGDVAMVRELLDRLEGKVTDKLDIRGEPVRISVVYDNTGMNCPRCGAVIDSDGGVFDALPLARPFKEIVAEIKEEIAESEQEISAGEQGQ